MSFCYLVTALVLFRVIIDGHPLTSLDSLADINSLGSWDILGSSSDQSSAGAPDSDFLLGGYGNAGNNIFATDSAHSANGIETNLDSSIFSGDVDLTSTGYADTSTNSLFDGGDLRSTIAEDQGCAFQARKRDGSDGVLLGKQLIMWNQSSE